MLKGYKIIDADSHVTEPIEMWGKYLDPKFKEFAPSPDMKIKGKPIVEKLSQQVVEEGYKEVIKSHPHGFFNSYNPESHVQAMVQMGIDLAFVYPSLGLWLFAIDTFPAEVIGAFTQAYNTWLHEEFCSYDPDRLKGVGAINCHNPEEMVQELHHIASLGWKAVVLRPNPVKGRILNHPDYELFWAACEDLDIAVGIHEGSHSLLPTTGADRFDTRFALHACSHPMEHMMALLALIEGGVLERHPKLRVAFLESGCGWLPYWLWRLDEEYKNVYWEMKDRVRLLPSEYFRRQCFIEIEPSEPYLVQIIDYIGSDNLIFGTDYPHIDHKPDVVEVMVGLDNQLSKEIIQKIIWHNPVRFYHLV